MQNYKTHSKEEIKEKLKIEYSSPLFFLPSMKVLNLYTSRELKEYLKDNHDKIIVLYPGVNALLFSSTWASLFSYSKYVLLCGRKDDKYVLKLKKMIEKQIFSIIRKKIEGAMIVDSEKECKEALSLLPFNSEVVVINNTESEL